MSKEKPSGIWGIKSPEFFFGLKDQPIHVAITGGKTLKGVLVGVDVYDIVLRQDSGLEILIPKHAIVYVHRAAAG